jgi:hypothetical protein
MVWLAMLVGLLCGEAVAGQDANDAFEIGQQWTYQHEGPRPGSMEPNDIDGERIMHIVGVVNEPEGKRWIIEERFTEDEKVTGRLYVNQQRLITAIVIENEKGETARLRYDPPVPYQVMELKIGEQKTIETSLKMDSAKITLPSTTTIQRLNDETIATSAGEFVGCGHYKITTKATLDIKIAKIPFTEERERWYHAKVNGLVKEVYRKGPIKFFTWSREGYTATSVLTAFGKKEVPADLTGGHNPANAKPEKMPLADAQPATHSGARVLAMALIALAVLSLGTYVVLRRAKRSVAQGSEK